MKHISTILVARCKQLHEVLYKIRNESTFGILVFKECRTYIGIFTEALEAKESKRLQLGISSLVILLNERHLFQEQFYSKEQNINGFWIFHQLAP